MQINITGDSLFSSKNLVNRLDSRILELLKEGDVNFTNAEFTIPKYGTPVAAGRGYVTAVREDRLDELVKLGFNAINFGNNHTGDFGIEGIKNTIKVAERRGLDPIGLGRSLDEVEKPRFVDTKECRVGIVSATATRGDLFLASRGGNGVVARPGVNPLRWNTVYEVKDDQYLFLEELRDQLGLTKSSQNGYDVERWVPEPEGTFKFGSLYEKSIQIRKSDQTKTVTEVNQSDIKEIERQIKDAKYRSDYVVFTIHTHEGANEDWYNDQPADFIVESAHRAIKAGADLVIGHGAHFLRGIEKYHGKPIFYNLGSFLMEFEAGESIIPPEMNAEYGHNENALPSVLHSHRAKENGEWVGFNSRTMFNDGLLIGVMFDDNQIKFKALPIDLRLQDKRILNHGIPVSANREISDRILKRLNEDSFEFNTKVSYDYSSLEFKIDEI